MESKTGGWLSIIGGILVILSIPYALYMLIELVSAEVGFTVTMDEVFGVVQDLLPALYVLIVTGIVINVVFGCLLIGFGGTFVGGRGSGAIAILMIIIGIIAIICSIAVIGGIVGLFGGILGIIGGYMSRKPKVPPPPPPTDIQ